MYCTERISITESIENNNFEIPVDPAKKIATLQNDVTPYERSTCQEK